jgi:iron complex outermembrane receptor protein
MNPFSTKRICNITNLNRWLFLQLLCFFISSLSVIIPAKAVALKQQEKIEDPNPFWLDIEQLSQMRIVSVSKYEEPVEEVATTVYVITVEDIKRSGAKSIPEVLCLAPGRTVPLEIPRSYYAKLTWRF